MPRRPRIALAGLPLHLIQRGNNRSACFFCDDDHAAYLDHWLKVLKEDKRAIFQASAHAQRAVDFLHGLQPEIPTPGIREGGQP